MPNPQLSDEQRIEAPPAEISPKASTREEEGYQRSSLRPCELACMPVPESRLRELAYQAIDQALGGIATVDEVYAWVEANTRLDADDLRPPMLRGEPVSEPNWKRNVRNALQSEKNALRLVNIGPAQWRRATPLPPERRVPRETARAAMDAARKAAGEGAALRDPITGTSYVLEGATAEGLLVRSPASGKETLVTLRDIETAIDRLNAAGGRTGRGTIHKASAKETIIVAMHPMMAWAHGGRDIVIRPAIANSTLGVGSEARQLGQDAFEAPASKDTREWVLRQVAVRQGQPGFRRSLLDAYEACCCMTAVAVPDCLQAAHIQPYRGPEWNHVQNGLLLRADLHTLFDLGMVGVLPGRQLVVADELAGSEYANLGGHRLREPREEEKRPSSASLAWHMDHVFRGA